MHTTTGWNRATVTAAGLGALLLTAGCGGVHGSRAAAESFQSSSAAPAGQTGLPIVVSCEPTQRTIVRPTMVNGVAMSQVECVAGEGRQQLASSPALAPPATAPLRATPVSYRVPDPQAVEGEVDDAEVVPVTSRGSAAGPVRARQTTYERRRPQGRTVRTSAIIIGSSAGVGAGVGGAAGGRKGALIGAVIGGGGAALWDQITRRKD